MHSNCKRARVAIDVPNLVAGDPYPLAPALHIGHARTVLLGSLIAEHYELPFHLRLDGTYNPGVSRDAAVLMPLCTIGSRLDVQCDKVYWIGQQGPSSAEYVAAFGDEATEIEELITVVSEHVGPRIAIYTDDSMLYWPSLIIRGTEFVHSEQAITNGDGVTLSTTPRFVRASSLIENAMGRERHEINVPLITMQGAKVSKSLSPTLKWEFFERYPGAWVRRFLLATAMKPDAPLKAIGKQFTLEGMSALPYEWNWATWDQYIRDCEAAQ